LALCNKTSIAACFAAAISFQSIVCINSALIDSPGDCLKSLFFPELYE
jgi:hypothetical protein